MKVTILWILSIISFFLFLRTLYELGWSYWKKTYRHIYGILLIFMIAAIILVAALWK